MPPCWNCTLLKAVLAKIVPIAVLSLGVQDPVAKAVGHVTSCQETRQRTTLSRQGRGPASIAGPDLNFIFKNVNIKLPVTCHTNLRFAAHPFLKTKFAIKHRQNNFSIPRLLQQVPSFCFHHSIYSHSFTFIAHMTILFV